MAYPNAQLHHIAWVHRITRPPFSNHIHYYPASPLIEQSWRTQLEVLVYLAEHPEDRFLLTEEAQRRSPHYDQTFYVNHPLLRGILKVTSNYPDSIFLFIIQDLIWKIEYPQRVRQLQWAQAQAANPPASQSDHHPTPTSSSN